MKFIYEFRSSDNVRHDGIISAPSREAVFLTLRAQGIRPERVVEAPGFFNKLLGKGKRWLAIAALAAISLIAIIYATNLKRQVEGGTFIPSRQYIDLERNVSTVIENAPEDINGARRRLRELFREHYQGLDENQRERQAAQKMYGSALLKLESIEEDQSLR